MEVKTELQRLEKEKWKLQERIYLLREKLGEAGREIPAKNFKFEEIKLKNCLQKLDKLKARIRREESRDTKWTLKHNRISRKGAKLPSIRKAGQCTVERKGATNHTAA